jgi:RNA polymerase sigma factor (sigma-70 family)
MPMVTLRAEPRLLEQMDRDNVTDAELFGRVRADPDAFGQLYDRYERPVLGFFLKRTADAEAAADLTAETFAALLDAARKGQAIDEPRAWLFSIGHRKLVDAYRRGEVDDKLRRKLQLEPLQLDDDDIARINDLAGGDEASRALAELPVEQRAAIEGRVLEGLSYEHLGATLRCSPAVVRKRVSRGLALLRSQIQEQQP